MNMKESENNDENCTHGVRFSCTNVQQKTFELMSRSDVLLLFRLSYRKIFLRQLRGTEKIIEPPFS